MKACTFLYRISHFVSSVIEVAWGYVTFDTWNLRLVKS